MQRIHVTIRPLNREDSVLYFPPEAFGPFRVLHQIGAGTLGPVFRAYEPADDRRDRLVAVKVFRLDLTPEQSAALVIELQALVAAHLKHPNIAAPIAAGLEHGAAYLAQEYAVGDSLDVILRERGLMPVRDVIALAEALGASIDHAAARGVHHGLLHMRDIVLAADAARITGFGIAAALSKIGAKLPTRTPYASPAVASDVYSLGAIAFEAATGKRASKENLQEFEAQHGRALREAFTRALDVNPQNRPKHASDFVDALRAAAPAPSAPNAPSAPVAPRAPDAPVAPVAPNAPNAPNAPVAPNAPNSPVAPNAPSEVDFLDPVIDLGPPVDPAPVRVKTLFPSAWNSEVPRAFAAQIDRAPNFDPNPESPHRRWPIPAMFVAFAAFAAIAVAFLLRSPRPTPAAEQPSGVEETVVDLPASAPRANARTAPGAPGAPSAPTAPNAPSAPNAPNHPPAPSPSRPASGAVRGAQTGSVLIRSTPADADVLVNGNPRGKTPLALRDLALGSYTIRVARDGYAIEERTVQLTPRRPTMSTTINLRTAGGNANTRPGVPPNATNNAGATVGGINVQSRPPGARVFINDRQAGATPVVISDLPAGPATVRIEMDGYQSWATTVRVSVGEQMRVAASLERK